MNRFFSGFIFLYSVLAASSGTGVGNGGDALFQYLKSTQDSIVSTLKSQIKNPLPVCTELEDDLQRKYCIDNFRKIAENLILKILQRAPELPVDLILREEPLFVPGPDSKPMSVAARTELGPSGPIEFHRPSLLNYAPAQMVFLLSHEYLHKIPIDGHYRGDYESIGPFARGRDFLDFISSEIQRLALAQGRLGKDFLLIDYFLCEFESDLSANSWNLRLFSLRSFLSPDLNQYQSGFGEGRKGGSVSRPYRDGELEFSVFIHEPQACEAEGQGRFTRLRLTMKYRDSRPDQIVDEKILEDFSPICGSPGGKLEMSYEQFRFSCAYDGSESLLQSF